MAQAKQDMGTGSIKKLMLQLMIPAVVAQVCLLYTSCALQTGGASCASPFWYYLRRY